MVKKVINNPKDVVQETITGYLMMHPGEFEQIEGYTAIVKTKLDPDKVGLVIGGGSGHEPIFLEFIGKGYPDAVAMGNIFAAPSPDIILAATKAVDRGKGVLYVYGNYAGDNLNFDMACRIGRYGRYPYRDCPCMGRCRLSATRTNDRQARNSRRFLCHQNCWRLL